MFNHEKTTNRISGDMSRRVVNVLSEFSPDIEVYSIDESFLEFTRQATPDLTELGHTIRDKVRQHTGIPVSVGFAPTKTLTKVAVKIAKKSAKANGVLDLTDSRYHDIALDRIPVEDIWGVGRRFSKFLRVYGITTARELKYADPEYIRRKMGVNGVRIIEELKGNCCYPLDSNPSAKKGITVSRSFGKEISSETELSEAVASYATRGAEKLRAEGLVANLITVFIMTNRFKPTRFYYNAHTVRLNAPTHDTTELIKAAAEALSTIFIDRYKYKKAGILLNELSTASMVQQVMFDKVDRKRSEILMAKLDTINSSMGRDTLKYASSGLQAKPAWRTQFSQKSPCYTTRWSDLLRVR